MTILSQDRTFISKINKECWVQNSETGEFEIINSERKKTVLGTYSNEKRATEVLKEIFQSIRVKKPCYAMPLE